MSAQPVDVLSALAIVAVVACNDREALVLNRPLRFVYERVGNDYIGSDGPFRDVLQYGSGYGMKAFAGRELSLLLTDGSTVKVKDRWWQMALRGSVGVAYSDVESLKRCYVFYGGACIAPDALAELRATYTGCVYPYWDYEKVVKFDDLRRDLWSRVHREESKSRALIAEARRKDRLLTAALARIGAA